MGRRIMIAFDGSRGDNQPYLVLARELIRSGFDVLALGCEEATDLAEAFGVPFKAINWCQKKTCTNQKFVDSMKTQNFGQMAEVHREVRPEGCVFKQCETIYEAALQFKPELLLHTWSTALNMYAISVILRIPRIHISLQTGLVASSSLPCPPLSTRPGTRASLGWYALATVLLRQWKTEQGPVWEKIFQRPLADFAPALQDYFDMMGNDSKFYHVVTETSLHREVPADFSSTIIRVGPMVAENAMQDFLAAGEPPVYFGFGSMIGTSSKFMTLLCLRALRLTGLRGVCCAGWSEMSLDLVDGEPDAEELKSYSQKHALFVKYAQHGSLFPRCCVIVHHGGTGTTNASLTSGVPTVILPVCFDQFAHSDDINELGCGVGLAAIHKLEPSDVSEAVLKCLRTPEICNKAREVATIIEKEKDEGPKDMVAFLQMFFKQFVDTGRQLKLQDSRTHFQLLPAVHHVPKMSPNHELLIGEASFKALSSKLKPELGSRTRVPDHCLSKCWALKLPDPLKEQYLLDYVRLLESLLPTFPEGIQVPFLPSNRRVVAPVAERCSHAHANVALLTDGVAQVQLTNAMTGEEICTVSASSQWTIALLARAAASQAPSSGGCRIFLKGAAALTAGTVLADLQEDAEETIQLSTLVLSAVDGVYTARIKLGEFEEQDFAGGLRPGRLHLIGGRGRGRDPPARVGLKLHKDGMVEFVYEKRPFDRGHCAPDSGGRYVYAKGKWTYSVPGVE
ncbi:ATG26, partial [Symbiodinium necroappetens]